MNTRAAPGRQGRGLPAVRASRCDIFNVLIVVIPGVVVSSIKGAFSAAPTISGLLGGFTDGIRNLEVPDFRRFRLRRALPAVTRSENWRRWRRGASAVTSASPLPMSSPPSRTFGEGDQQMHEETTARTNSTNFDGARFGAPRA